MGAVSKRVLYRILSTKKCSKSRSECHEFMRLQFDSNQNPHVIFWSKLKWLPKKKNPNRGFMPDFYRLNNFRSSTRIFSRSNILVLATKASNKIMLYQPKIYLLPQIDIKGWGWRASDGLHNVERKQVWRPKNSLFYFQYLQWLLIIKNCQELISWSNGLRRVGKRSSGPKLLKK